MRTIAGADEVWPRGRDGRARCHQCARGTVCRMEHFLTGRDVGVVVAVSDDEPDLIVITAMEL